MPSAIEVMADAAQLLRVFENLGRNARQAGAGSVRVAAFLENRALIVEVADDGPGMPAKATGHLFQPFAGSAREGGTGLGLVIAREVVHAHGGATPAPRARSSACACIRPDRGHLGDCQAAWLSLHSPPGADIAI